MVKLVVLYKKPADVRALKDHFSSVHLQLMEQVPGIVKTELARFFAGPTGEPPYYMLFEWANIRSTGHSHGGDRATNQ